MIDGGNRNMMERVLYHRVFDELEVIHLMDNLKIEQMNVCMVLVNVDINNESHFRTIMIQFRQICRQLNIDVLVNVHRHLNIASLYHCGYLEDYVDQ